MEKQNNRLITWLLQLMDVQLTVHDGTVSAVVPQRTRRELSLAAIITVGIILLALVWVGLGVFVAKNTIGNTTVRRSSNLTDYQKAVERQTKTYKLTFSYPDGSKKQFAPEEMGLKPNASATIVSAKSAGKDLKSRFLWWKPVPVPIVLSVDAAELNTFISENAVLTTQPAKDATLSIENGEVKVSDASAGKRYGLLQPQHMISTAVSNLQTQPLKLSTLTLRPALTTEQLESSRTKIDSVLKQQITFTLGSKTITPTPTDIATWLELTPNSKTKTVDVDVNSGKVQEYINKLAAAQIRSPRDQVVITHDDGSSSVIVSGINGVDVTNKSGVATNVSQNLLDGKGLHVDLPISTAAYKTVTTASYPKWIEVDLTNKRMYTYEQSDLVRIFLVTAGAPATPTVTGKYAIYAKYAQQDMRGQNVDGSQYFQPNVQWVNYFYKDYAIHGNYWRPLSYFGNINSSHGCVSVVDDEAAWIYNWAPIGTPVIVHS